MQVKEQKESMIDAIDLVTRFIVSIQTEDSLPEEYANFVSRLQSYSSHIEKKHYNLLLDYVLASFDKFSSGLYGILPLSAMMGAVAEDDSLSADWNLRELADAEFTLKKAELLRSWYTFVISNNLLN